MNPTEFSIENPRGRRRPDADRSIEVILGLPPRPAGDSTTDDAKETTAGASNPQGITPQGLGPRPRRRPRFLEMYEDFSRPRECPACHNVYPTDHEHVGEHWYPMRTRRRIAMRDPETGEYLEDAETGDPVYEWVTMIIPSTYCKTCEKKRTTESRRLRRQIAKLPPDARAAAEATKLGGRCASCGDRKKRGERSLVEHPNGKKYALCGLCTRAVAIADFDPATARQEWLHIWKHLKREEAAERQWAQKSNKPRRWHSYYRRVDGSWPKATEEDLWHVPEAHVQCLWVEKAWRNAYRWLAALQAGEPTPQRIE